MGRKTVAAPSPPAAPADREAVARTRGLNLRFPDGAHVVRGVDIEIGRGEILGLVGESGSGKTMLGHALLGLAPAGAELTGEAWLGDVEMVAADSETRREARRRRAGAVFQDPMTSLNPTMKIGRQVAEAADSAAAVEESLRQVGFPEPDRRIHQYPHELSGGLRQRVMIAMAIARRPSLVLLDEPTTALDVTLQRTTLRLLAELRDELGMAMLFITHDLAVAAELVDRVAVMYGGRIAEIGSPDDVFVSPSHPYTAGLLASRHALAGADAETELATLRGEPLDPRQPPPGCPFAPRCDFVREACLAAVPALRPAASHPGLDACIRSAEIELRPRRQAVAAAPATASAVLSGGAALELVGVEKAFSSRRHEQQAVAGVSLTIPRSGSLALVGASGCGKTTTLRIAVGLEQADAGDVRHAPGGRPQMVFQDAGASLTPWMTIGAMLRERLRGEGLDKLAQRRRVEETLALVGLSAEVAAARPGRLSGGQRQRAALARAVIVPPTLLACDEPTSALDVSLAAVAINLLRKLRRELDVALLFVTHDLAVARAVADEIAVMSEGRIVERGSAAEVLAHPSSEKTRELLEAVPTMEREWL
ncbi:MAG: hypothetical protein BGO11_07350 [Solirubrobacterales bacterium 70-9]|nr:MAG: hypothetical protein BGO11_07350 [Solirubrobacterales bacterium 70-9]